MKRCARHRCRLGIAGEKKRVGAVPLLIPCFRSSEGMEADDLLCSRNAPGFVCLVGWSFWSVWFFLMNFRSDQPDNPDRPDEPAFVGRAQWKISQPPSLRDNKRAWKNHTGFSLRPCWTTFSNSLQRFQKQSGALRRPCVLCAQVVCQQPARELRVLAFICR